MLRKETGAIEKTALDLNPQGYRRRGKPRRTWWRTVEDEIRSTRRSWNKVKGIAGDRNAWKLFMDALCSTRSKRICCCHCTGLNRSVLETATKEIKQLGYFDTPLQELASISKLTFCVQHSRNLWTKAKFTARSTSKEFIFLTPKPLCTQTFQHMLPFLAFCTSFKGHVEARLFNESNSPKVLK